MNTSNRPVIGFKFKCHDGNYYGALGQGSVALRSEAYVYTNEELKEIGIHEGWGDKLQGKWQIVYASRK